MRLYFLRHASASDIAPTDAERSLTDAGREEARIAGAALAALGAKPTKILTSPLLRARQTAEHAAAPFGIRPEPLEELQNEASTPALIRTLSRYADANEIVLVGHMPSLSEHIAALVGAQTAGAVALGKAGVACVELDELRPGAGQLRWLMRHEQLRQIAA